MITAVIFDMDGVLIDSEEIYLGWVSDYAMRLGYSLPKEVLHKTVGLSSALISDYFEEVLGAGKGAAFWSGFMEESVSYEFDLKEALNPGVKEILRNLQEKKIKIGLASASSHREINNMLEANELRLYFDVILSGTDFVKSKPDPEIYLTAIEKVNSVPEECVIIEDSTYGIAAGKAAGATVIGIEERRFGFDQQEADYLVKDMNAAWAVIEELCVKD